MMLNRTCWMHWMTAAILSLGMVAAAQAAVPPDFADLVEKQSPAVVNITTVQTAPVGGWPGRALPGNEEMLDFFRRMMPPEAERHFAPRRGQGSGVIVSANGDILTNAHVVDGAEEVVVKLHDRREFRARVVGRDEHTDIALIHIQAEGLPAARIGDPDKMRVGEWVLAIGAPFGFENSVTAGIVSALGRSLPRESYVPYIQTDVAVNPGNSGGPLLNMKGEVVGVNSQIISRSGGYMGLSFAIPINVAMDVAAQIRAKGKVTRGRMGILVQDVSADFAESFGLGKPRGALVAEVEAGGPADKAGLKPADIVLSFNGKAIEESGDLPRLVGTTPPGKQVPVSVWRKGKTVNLTAVAGELTDKAGESGVSGDSQTAGLVVTALSAEDRRTLGVKHGLRVEESTGAAARAGLRPGDVILSVDQHDVASVTELSRRLNESRRTIHALLIRRGERTLFLSLRLEP